MGAAAARRAGLEKNVSASINLSWILLLLLRVVPLSLGRPGSPAPRNQVRVALVHAGHGPRDHAFLELLLDGLAERQDLLKLLGGGGGKKKKKITKRKKEKTA